MSKKLFERNFDDIGKIIKVLVIQSRINKRVGRAIMVLGITLFIVGFVTALIIVRSCG